MQPGITETTLDGQLGSVPAALGVPYAVIFTSTKGPFETPSAFADKDYLPTNFGAGPGVEFGAQSINNTRVPAIMVRAHQTVAGSAGAAVNAADGTCSAVVKTGTGSFVPTIDTGPKPDAEHLVRVDFPVGGTLGTAGAVYVVTVDGVAGTATALGTAKEIDLTSYIGAVTLILTATTETIVDGDYLTFTTTAPVLASDGTLDQSHVTGGCAITISSGVVKDDSGTPGAVTKHGTGSFSPSPAASPAPTGAFTVRVDFLAGGTLATAGIRYRVTVNGTVGPVTALGTATTIDLATYIGAVSLVLGTGTISTADYVTFTTIGVPADDCDVTVKVVAGGTVGSPGISYQISLDDSAIPVDSDERVWGPVTALGSATYITVSDVGGFRFVLAGASPTLVAGDYWSTRTKAPNWNANDLGAALDALDKTDLTWRQVIVVGPISSSTLQVLEGRLEGWSADGKPREAICHYRMPNLGEDLTTYDAAFAADLGALVSVDGKIMVYKDAATVVSALTGHAFRRPAMWEDAALECTVSPEIDRAQIDPPGGPLPATKIRDGRGNVRHHDERVTPTSEPARCCALKTWSDYKGVYVCRPRTFCVDGSDFTLWPRRRVFSLCRIANRKFFEHVLSKGVPADKNTGYIREYVAQAWERQAKQQVAAACPIGEWVSDVDVKIRRTDNLLPDGAVMNVTLQVGPLIYVERIKITNAMRRPAAA